MVDQQKKPVHKLLLQHLRYHAQRMIASGRSGDPTDLSQLISSTSATLILQLIYAMQIPNEQRQGISEDLKSIATQCRNRVLSDELGRLAEQILQESWIEETYILVFEDNQQELVCPILYTDKKEAEDTRDKWNECETRVAVVVPI